MVTYFILGLADLCFLGSLKFTVNKVSLASSKIKLSAVVISPRIALQQKIIHGPKTGSLLRDL